MNQKKKMLELAAYIGNDWKEGPYYAQGELDIDIQWNGLIWPFIKGNNFSEVIDLAGGHGRNTLKLLDVAKNITIIDINHENIEFCQTRFKNHDNVKCLLNDGISLEGIEDSSVSFIYCFDAMIHFDSDVIRNYLKEFVRVLSQGGRGFCHHSNYTRNPAGDIHDNPSWRNFMSARLFAHYCAKEGLRILKQQIIPWNDIPDLDCFSLFEKKR